MKMLNLVMNMALVAMLVQLATATDHIVGAPSGSWDPTTSLQTWCTSQKFMVGDNLVFQYSAAHDVLEVSKSDYESCAISNPLMIEMSGNTVVPLTSAGKRYFVCGIPGHCSLGMKIEVDIQPATTKPPPSPPTPSVPTPSKPPPSFSPKTPSLPKSPPSFSPKTPSLPKSPPSFSPKTPSLPKSPPSFSPKTPSLPKSPFSKPHVPPLPPSSSFKTPVPLPPSSSFKPKSPFHKKHTPTPPPSSSIAPSKMPKSPIAYAPAASPKAGGPTSPVGSPALAATSSAPMNSGFQPALTIAIAMALIAIQGF